MSSDIRHHLSDPRTDPGWDYYVPDVGEHYGSASIAMWTWARKGYFPPNTQVRPKNADSWMSLDASAPEIIPCARAQFARKLFSSSENRKWYWMQQDGEIDSNGYSGSDMLYYMGNGHLPGDTKISWLDGERGPPPRSSFKSFIEILEDFMNKDVAMPKTPRSEVAAKENGNSLIGNGGEVHMEKQPLTATPVSIPNFADLQKLHREELFADASLEWYTWYEDRPMGPYQGDMMLQLSWQDSLPDTYPLAHVSQGAPAPTCQSSYKKFVNFLAEIHVGEQQ